MTLMYSMPQQAVTNGYWKREFARAQPSAPESLRSKKPSASSLRVSSTGNDSSGGSCWLSGTFPSGFRTGSLLTGAPSRPLQRAFAPDVDETQRQSAHEGEHLEIREPAEPFGVEVAQQRAPRVDEDALHVEDDEEERHQVELDRVAGVRLPGRWRTALEGALLDAEDPLGAEVTGEHADRGAHHPCQEQQDQHGDVGREIAVHGRGTPSKGRGK